MDTAHRQQLLADLRQMTEMVTRAQDRLARAETDECLAIMQTISEAQQIGQTAVGRLSAACWQQKTEQAANPHCPPAVVDDLAPLAAFLLSGICPACQAAVSKQLAAAKLE
jgi:hypothetical protein